MCVGCRRVASKAELVRLCRPEGGEAQLDLAQRGTGRGAYLHPDGECVQAARRRRSLERALRGPLQPEVWEQLQELAGRFR